MLIEMIRLRWFGRSNEIVTKAGCRRSRLYAPVLQKISTGGYLRRRWHGRRFVSCYRSWGNRSPSDEMTAIYRSRRSPLSIRGPCAFPSRISRPAVSRSTDFSICQCFAPYIFSMDYISVVRWSNSCHSLLDGMLNQSAVPKRNTLYFIFIRLTMFLLHNHVCFFI